MRRSGRTTRLIDEAIQILFTEGQVTLIDHPCKDDNPARPGILPAEIIEARLSRRMGSKVQLRLGFEHPGVKYSTIEDKGFVTIKLTDHDNQTNL